MRAKTFACVCIGIFAFAAHTASAQMLVGPNLEWSYWSFPKIIDIKSGSAIAVGGYYLSPGLRVGYLFPGAAVTATADVGIQNENLSSTYKYTNVMIEPGLAYAFMSKGTTSPYVGACAGWHTLSPGSVGSVTRSLVGVSAGVRHRVAAGHGLIRAELRYDHFTTTDTKGFVLPQDIVGIRLGADLLLTQ
jgi:hypothetical protein